MTIRIILLLSLLMTIFCINACTFHDDFFSRNFMDLRGPVPDHPHKGNGNIDV